MKKILMVEKALPSVRRNVFYILSIFAILYVLILYSLGLRLGFYTATIKFTTYTIKKFILPITFTIILIECFREKILEKKPKYKSLVFIITTLVDIFANIAVGAYDITNPNDILTIVGYIISASIANNLLFNYISLKYGKFSNIIYRLITTLYIYIIPITPDIHILIHTLIKLLFPYFIYIVLDYLYPEKKEYIQKKIKRKNGLLGAIITICMVIITMLVSCKFKYCVLVIGSESMTGVINKGDAIIYEKYENQKIQNNQILVFKSDKRIIIHRVIEIKNVDNEKRYYTKGDANKEKDYNYITDKDIIGIYKFKISKIGYLTLFFNNI